ncbi:hypothetical protein KKC13_00565 [bacterium]|nr:hypothetical protein [bacterium]MBU1958868.1 hypothetical protein [bacterium]
MKRSGFISTMAIVLFAGCATTTTLPTNLGLEASQSNVKTLSFATDKSKFMTKLGSNISIQNRNAYMDEFIFQSDIQCQRYLNNPLTKGEKSSTESNLYMNLFDTVSAMFGMKYITDSAKSALMDDKSTNAENQQAYENALSPEIRRGVEIARVRYAKEMMAKKSLPIDRYGSVQLEEDMNTYDKQCNDEYGLIEINRALKDMQNQMRTGTVPTQQLMIDPQAIKDKVTAVTNEVKEKEANMPVGDNNISQ